MLDTKYAVPIEIPSNGIYICSEITKIDNNFLGVQLTSGNNIINAVMSFQDENYLSYLNQHVEVDFRTEPIHGMLCLYINNYTLYNYVNIVPKEQLFKLYLDSPQTVESNIIFDNIKEYEEVLSAKLYCIKSCFKASERSVWQELRLMDKNRKICTGRIFNYTNKDASFSGKYIYCTFIKTQYGLNISAIKPIAEKTAAINPIVQVAKAYIQQIIPTLSEHTQNFVKKTDFLNFLEHRIPDYDLEIGFDLVRIATALALSEPYKNLTKNINYKLIQESLILKESGLILNDAQYYNKDVKNVIAIASNGKLGSKKTIHCLTSSTAKHMLEHEIIDNLSEIALIIVTAETNQNLI